MTTDHTDRLAEELRQAIGTFVRAARQQDTVGANQAAVLGFLARDGAQSIADLAARAQVRHQSMTRTVRTLEDAGWADLHPDPQDRRRQLVAITLAGQAHLAAERQRRSHWIAGAIRTHLTAQEQAQLAALPALLARLTGAPE